MARLSLYGVGEVANLAHRYNLPSATAINLVNDLLDIINTDFIKGGDKEIWYWVFATEKSYFVRNVEDDGWEALDIWCRCYIMDYVLTDEEIKKALFDGYFEHKK